MSGSSSPVHPRGRPRVLLAEDHSILREAIQRLLTVDCEVAGTVADGRELLDAAARLRPDVVIMDVSMPVINGIEAARRLRHVAPEAKIVFLTQQSSKTYVREAFRAGAGAYVLKQSAASELSGALLAVLSGRYFLSLSIAETIPSWEQGANVNPADLLVPALSPRQRELMVMIAAGKTTGEMAAQMGVTTKTVEFHVQAIMSELGLSTTDELKEYAIAHQADSGRPAAP